MLILADWDVPGMRVSQGSGFKVADLVRERYGLRCAAVQGIHVDGCPCLAKGPKCPCKHSCDGLRVNVDVAICILGF